MNWIECSFCSDWFHGVCVGLQFTDESAKGIVRFKCPNCRNNSLQDEDDIDDYQSLIEEKQNMVEKMDKLNLIIDQERSEIENLKNKIKEQIKDSLSKKSRRIPSLSRP